MTHSQEGRKGLEGPYEKAGGIRLSLPLQQDRMESRARGADVIRLEAVADMQRQPFGSFCLGDCPTKDPDVRFLRADREGVCDRLEERREADFPHRPREAVRRVRDDAESVASVPELLQDRE